jgi:peroxiredoxin
VLAVDVDEPDARVRQFQIRTKVDLTVLMDPNKQVTRSWAVRTLPATFIVGPDGRVRYQHVGDLDWSSEPVMIAIVRLMGPG